MSLERFIKFIKEGEPVSPGTPNRPLQQLDQNIQYLWNVIQAAGLGSTVYARAQTVAATLQVGQPVYFNTTTARFEAAFATAESDTATGYLVVPDQAQVWGIVAEKQNATLADILLFGYAQIDIRAAVGTELNPDDSVPTGTWYLSGTSVGTLTRQLPPITIPVLKTTANGGVYVNPSFVDFLENHRHYVFELTMAPAGSVTAPSSSGTHTITSANATLSGWLPADHVSFDDLAPAGAKFGYNLAADPALRNVYPPVPLQSACIQMQRPSPGRSTNVTRMYGQQLMDDLVVIDRNGIWWMSDCYDEVPWPTLLTTGTPLTSYTECDPRSDDYMMKFYFTRVGFATDNSTVSSLRSVDERLVITCDGTTTPATTGDLQIDLNLNLMTGNTTLVGYNVFKAFDATTGKFELGPVVEGVYTTTPNVQLEGTHTTSRLIDGVTRTLHHGPVRINMLPQPTLELSSQLVRLDGVTEENYPVLYLGMSSANTTRFIVKFEVPSDVVDSSGLAVSTFLFRFRMRLLGRGVGTLPPLHISHYVVPRPGVLSDPVAVSPNYTDMDINTAATLASANYSVEAVGPTAGIEVNSGSLIYVEVERVPANPADNYNFELGIMQMVGVLTSAEPLT